MKFIWGSGLGLGLGALLVSSCSSPPGNSEPVDVPLQFTVSTPFFLTDSKRTLYRSLRDGETITHGMVSHAWTEDHYRNWQERHPDSESGSLTEVFERIQELGQGITPRDLAEYRAELESRMQGKRRTGIQYNAQSVSVVDTLQEGKLQAYSGTVLLHLVLREAWGPKAAQAANLVAIFESGHVLPGYLVKQDDGVWHMYGVETTVGGLGRVVYGPVEQAVKERMLRVVGADLFAIVEMYKFDADDILDLANQALKLTAKKYGIAEPAYLVPGRFRREVDYVKLAWSPFGFGNPDVGNINRVRAEFDEKKRTELPRLNPNLTIAHTATPAQLPDASADGTVDAPRWDNPKYPYREVTQPEGGRLFQCWDYAKREWIDMPHTQEGEVCFIEKHPCVGTNAAYPPLPLPLKVRVPPHTPGERGEWNDDDE